MTLLSGALAFSMSVLTSAPSVVTFSKLDLQVTEVERELEALEHSADGCRLEVLDSSVHGTFMLGAALPDATDLSPEEAQVQTRFGPLKRQHCEIAFERTTFDSTLDLSRLASRASITLNHSTFAALNASQSSFMHTLSCEGCKVASSTGLTGSQFREDVDFSDAQLESVLANDATIFGAFRYQRAVTKWLGFFAQTKFIGGAFFDDADFKHKSMFVLTEFNSATFNRTRFRMDATFASSRWSQAVEFIQTQFDDKVSFTSSILASTASLDFSNATFSRDAFFDSINTSEQHQQTGRLSFSDGTLFSGRAYFRNSELRALAFSPRDGQRPVSPTTLTRRAVLQSLKVDFLHFGQTEIRELLDLSDTQARRASFVGTTCEGEIIFSGSAFREFEIGQTRLLGKTNATWRQLSEGIVFRSQPMADDWARLRDMFIKSGDLDGQIESEYRRKLLESKVAGPSDFLDWLVWGYGLRPVRLAGWMIFVLLFFGAIYWTQASSLENRVGRVSFALHFSWSNSWKLGFGITNSRSFLFKSVTLVQSITFKAMGILLLHALSNVSPVLKAVLGKVLPF